MKTHTINYYNPKYTSKILNGVMLCLEERSDAIVQQEISKYGIHDDFLFAEFLSDYFSDLQQEDRYVAMQMIRHIINSSGEGYVKALDNGMSKNYEPFRNGELSLDEFIDQIKVVDEFDDF